MRSLPLRKHITTFEFKEISKLSFKKKKQRCVQDDGTVLAWVYMYVCECVYLSLIDRANKRRTIEAFEILFGYRNEMYGNVIE